MTSFADWLEKSKGFSFKVSHDILSRKKRILSFTGEQEVTKMTLQKAEGHKEFLALSISVKSQLRRSVRLYWEYLEQQ